MEHADAGSGSWHGQSSFARVRRLQDAAIEEGTLRVWGVGCGEDAQASVLGEHQAVQTNERDFSCGKSAKVTCTGRGGGGGGVPCTYLRQIR